MNETELDKALAALERAAEVHCSVVYGDNLDLSDDLSMQPHKRVERITEYLRGLME